MPRQVPLAVGDPVPAALAVPPLRLRHVSSTAHPQPPALPADRPDGWKDRRPAGSHGLVMHVLRYHRQPCADRQHDDGEQHAES
jgi:hypothetical protein